MFYAYVLNSIEHDYFYKGHCKDVNVRLQQHNSGMTESMRPYVPFEVAYIEEFSTEKAAIDREKYFKSAAGRRFLKKVMIP